MLSITLDPELTKAFKGYKAGDRLTLDNVELVIENKDDSTVDARPLSFELGDMHYHLPSEETVSKPCDGCDDGDGADTEDAADKISEEPDQQAETQPGQGQAKNGPTESGSSTPSTKKPKKGDPSAGFIIVGPAGR